MFGLGSEALLEAASGGGSSDGDQRISAVMQAGIGMLPLSLQDTVMQARHELAVEMSRALGIPILSGGDPLESAHFGWNIGAALSMPRLRRQVADHLGQTSFLSVTGTGSIGSLAPRIEDKPRGADQELHHVGSTLTGPGDANAAVVDASLRRVSEAEPADGRRMLLAYRRYLLALLRAKHCMLEDGGELGGPLALVRTDAELSALESALRTGP